MRRSGPLAILAFVLVASPSRADEEWVVFRLEQDGLLLHLAFPAGELEATRERFGMQKTLVATLLVGTHPSREAAEAAGRADADRTGFFDCWRCRGTGELRDSARTQPCPVCRGAKRIQTGGYVVYRLDIGASWTYRLAIRSMYDAIEKRVKDSKPRASVRAAREFAAGEHEAAKSALDSLARESAGKSGYVGDIETPGLDLPEFEWPRVFFAAR